MAKSKQTDSRCVTIRIGCPPSGEYWCAVLTCASGLEYQVIRPTYPQALAAILEYTHNADELSPEVLIV